MEKSELSLKIWKEGEDIKHTFSLVENVNQEDIARIVLELERILTKLKKFYNRKSYDNDISIDYDNEFKSEDLRIEFNIRVWRSYLHRR